MAVPLNKKAENLFNSTLCSNGYTLITLFLTLKLICVESRIRRLQMILRPRQKQPFSGFTKAEVQKMEKLLNESDKQSLDKDFFKNLAKVFNRSSNRAGKRCLKWTEIQSWFEENQQNCLLDETSFDSAKKSPVVPETPIPNVATDNLKIPEGEKGHDMPRMEFEVRSKDGAWYDVDTFLSHRFLSSGEIEVYVRYLGFGADEDEWVNVKKDVRERSVALENSECHKVKAGDLVVCFQENIDQARYYDAHVIDIQRRLHDIRGCRCLFLIRYDHDNSQEEVRLRRLCFRPSMLARVDIS